MSTKLQLTTSVLAEVGRPDLATKAEEWFDEIYQAMLTFHDWSFITTLATRATAVDLYRIGLPSDFRKLYAIYLDTGDSNAKELKKLGLAEFVRQYPRVESLAAGNPAFYTLYGTNILVAPKCSSAAWNFKIIYCYNPPNIATGSVPVIPEGLYNCLKAGLRALFYASIKEFEKAEKQNSRFNALLKVYKESDEDDQEGDLFLEPFIYRGLRSAGSEYWNNPAVMRQP